MDKIKINQACIIDDDKLYVSLIKMIIKKNNLAKELIVFENGQKAFDYFKAVFDNHDAQLPEIILLDLNMPVMNGWEFLEAIDAYAHKFLEKGVKLNIVSSTINPLEVKKAKSHSIVTDFLTKPISKEAMRAVFNVG